MNLDLRPVVITRLDRGRVRYELADPSRDERGVVRWRYYPLGACPDPRLALSRARTTPCDLGFGRRRHGAALDAASVRAESDGMSEAVARYEAASGCEPGADACR